jgi:GNAT superfamily N-acetyltransferase
VKFVVGCDLEEFKRYRWKLAEDENWRRIDGFSEELDEEWESRVTENPSLLIVWRLGGDIVGHAIWHESSTGRHREGDARDREDREILESLVGGKKEFVELHEAWLRKEFRDRDFGKRFFEFFEEFMRSKSHGGIVYYTDHPAAIAICRRRGYKEEYWKEKAWHASIYG